MLSRSISVIRTVPSRRIIQSVGKASERVTIATIPVQNLKVDTGAAATGDDMYSCVIISNKIGVDHA